MSGFTLAPRAILDTDRLTDNTKIIYLKLCDFAYNSIYCFPTLETLCKALKLSDSTVKRATKELREMGLIRIYRKSLKEGNHYLIIPIDWVANLDPSRAVEVVPESEQYIPNEVEFTRQIEEIKAYFEALGKKLAGTSTRTKAVRKGQAPKTMDDLIEEVSLKMVGGDYTLNARELCIVFAKYVKEIRQTPYTVVWGRDGSIMKQVFINKDYDSKTAVRMIEKFVESYDRVFKKPKYEFPQIQYLRLPFIFDKVKAMMDYEGNIAQAVGAGEEVLTF